METVNYTTQDKRTLEADVYRGKGEKWAVLMHMMPATKESFSSLAKALEEKGISCIAFDQRGHGASQGGPDAFKDFTDFEQQAKIKDVEATIQYLLDDEVLEENIILVGASVGANLALMYLSQESKIPAAVALSPGLDYRGLVTEDIVHDLESKQRILLIASREDEYAALSADRLYHSNDSHTELIMKEGIGHGTKMLESDIDLFEHVIEWIEKNL